jgi:hypothetical protein
MKNNSSGCEAYRRTPSQAFCGTPWNGGWRIVLKGEERPVSEVLFDRGGPLLYGDGSKGTQAAAGVVLLIPKPHIFRFVS